MGHTVPWRVGKPHQYEFLRTEMRSEEGRRSGVKRQKPRCVKTKRNLFSGRSEKRDGTKRRRMRRGRQAGKVEAVEHKWNISRREDSAEERWAGSGGESSPPSFSRPRKGRGGCTREKFEAECARQIGIGRVRGYETRFLLSSSSIRGAGWIARGGKDAIHYLRPERIKIVERQL